MHAVRLATFALLTIAATASDASWPKSFHGSVGSTDTGVQVTMDSEANVYVVGNITSSLGTSDMYIAKYGQNGVTQWSEVYDSLGHDYAADVAVDATGNVYVTGRTNGLSDSFDIVTLKFDSDGERKWSRRIDGPARGDDSAAAIKIDNAGNVVVTGTQAAQSENFVTAKYTSNGGLIWLNGFSGSSDGRDNAVDLVIGQDDNIYVTGRSETMSDGFDFATIKYSASGNREWLRTIGGNGFGDDIPAGIAIDENEDVVVSGTSLGFISNDILTVRYGESGVKEWQYRLGSLGVNEYANAVTMDHVGNVYVAGTTGGGDDSKVLVFMLAEAGSKQWSKTYSASTSASYNVGAGIEVLGDGTVYVGATTSSDNTDASKRMTVLKYTNDGARIAAARFGLGQNPSLATGFALDKTTFRAFVTGSAFNSASGSYDGLTARK